MGIVGTFAEFVYVREDALRLLLSILAGYPLAAIHRTFLYNKPKEVQHYYFVFAGLLIYLFNCGFAIYHSLLSIGIAYIIINTIPGTPLSVALAHIAFLGHLLIGYWFAESSIYDITWTTPFCIMTLRFIGLVMDVYDGHQPNAAEKLKPGQLKTAIMDKPDLLEIAAYGLFFSGTLVGPQFPLSRFRSFVRGEYLDGRKNEVRESSIMASIQRFVAGVFFAVMHQWGTLWVSDDFFNSAEFLALWNTFYSCLIYFMVWPLSFNLLICSIIRKHEIYKMKIDANQQQKNYQADLSFWNGEESQNQILVNEFGFDITRKDLLALSGTGWLNDEIINFYINLIVKRNSEKPNLPKIYAFNTFFYPKLSQFGFCGVKHWTRKMNIFEYQILIVPIHLGNHWCMAIIDFELHRIDYYDSMLNENQKCLDILREYLIEESMDKMKRQFKTFGWNFVCRKDIPHQINTCDCGAFACLFAEYASRRAPITFDQKSIPYFRERMVKEICQKKIYHH